MNYTKFLFLSLLMLLTLIQCKSKINLTTPEKISEPTSPPPTIKGEIKIDTMSFIGYEIIDQDFTDTMIQFRISHFPEKKMYVYEDLKTTSFKKEILYDSIGLKQVTKWKKGSVIEKILVQWNKIGKPQQIETFGIKNDSLQLTSKEKYGYVDGVVASLYFKDFEWIADRKFLRETLISYEYDALKRKASSIVKVKHNDLFYPRDSVKYFYKGDSKIPYEVHRKLEKGAKYKITKPSDTTLKIVTILPDGKRDLLRTELITFDNKNRIIENVTNERFEPQEYPARFYKNIVTYPDDSRVSNVPNLIFIFNPSFSKNNIPDHIESIVNPGFYRDATIRTDIGYYDIPKTTISYRSSDGKNWKAYSKLILHE